MRRLISALAAPLLLLVTLPASASAILAGTADAPAPQAEEPAATGAIEAERDANADTRIAERIRGIFAAIDALSRVQVAVEQGVVTLTGTVAQPEQVEQAAAIAGRVSGVVTVDNRIERDVAVSTNLAPAVETIASQARGLLRALPLLGVALLVAVLVIWLTAWLSRRRSLWRRVTPNMFVAELLGSAVQFVGVLFAIYLALKILGATATLEYRAVVEGNAYEALESGRVPPDARIYYRRDQTGFDGNPVPVLLSKRIIVSGDQLINAASGFDPQTGQPEVNVTLDNVGAQRMLDFTTDNVGNGMAVVYIERVPETRVVDGEEVRTTRITEEVISVATIQGVFGKRFRTTGLESPKYASDLALLLRAGSLAAPVDIVEERVIGPSLGQENIEAGRNAIILGFLLVCVLMMAYYKLFGIIAVTALFTNLLMLAAVLSAINATLTMPGIAGIVLTVGMAVDANVLIFERIREELRNGNSLQSSIHAGYDKAFSTIADANVTTLIAAIVLFMVGTGAVKGFAVTLSIGILTSMFTAIMGTRAVVNLVYGGRRLRRISI